MAEVRVIVRITPLAQFKIAPIVAAIILVIAVLAIVIAQSVTDIITAQSIERIAKDANDICREAMDNPNLTPEQKTEICSKAQDAAKEAAEQIGKDDWITSLIKIAPWIIVGLIALQGLKLLKSDSK